MGMSLNIPRAAVAAPTDDVAVFAVLGYEVFEGVHRGVRLLSSTAGCPIVKASLQELNAAGN